MDFNTTKNLGGIGALLLFIGILLFNFSFFSGILSIVGLILILVALNGFAEIYKERRIFNNTLYGIFLIVIGVALAVVVATALLFSSFVNFIQLVYPGWSGPPNWSALSGMTPVIANITAENLFPIIAASIVGLIVVWLIVWVFTFATTFFVRKSLILLSAKSGTNLISTVGLVMLIGGALTVVFIGFLLIWFDFLLLAFAFFTLKRTETSEPPGPTSTPTATVSTA
jgi:uncharacterized membrane protein